MDEFIVGNRKIYNQDCMVGMAQYPDNYFDLAIVDPPYGIGMAGGKVGNSKKDYKKFAGADEKIPDKAYFAELFRVSKNQIVWGGNYMIEHLFPMPCFLVWDKVQPEKFTMAMCEFAWTSFNSPAKIYKKRIVGADKVRIHPTQKPVALYSWLLQNYAKPDFKILDTHLGSGSHAIAWERFQKSGEFVGFELDPDYFVALKQRIKGEFNFMGFDLSDPNQIPKKVE
jgi:site-specific DNA-methyltransferase (adenine-specific)